HDRRQAPGHPRDDPPPRRRQGARRPPQSLEQDRPTHATGRPDRSRQRRPPPPTCRSRPAVRPLVRSGDPRPPGPCGGCRGPRGRARGGHVKLEEAINALPDLTSRQREVVALIVQGLTYAEIGVALAISEVMAATHAARARERLGCRN